MSDSLDPMFPDDFSELDPDPNPSPRARYYDPGPLLHLLERVRQETAGGEELSEDDRDRFDRLVYSTYPHFQERFRPIDIDDADQRIWEIIEPDLAEPRAFDKMLFQAPLPQWNVTDKDAWTRKRVEAVARKLQGLEDPQADLMSTPLAQGSVEGLTPLRVARLLLTLLRLGEEFDGQIETLVRELRERPGPLGRGALLFYLGIFKKYDEALTVRFDPRLTNLLALEEEVYALYGLSLAYTQTGDAAEGHRHLFMAVRLAKRLGMLGRHDLFNIERARVLMLEARPSIELVRQLRASPHLTNRQAHNIASLYIDHLIMFGGYTEALARSENVQSITLPPRRAFLQALLHQTDPASDLINEDFPVLAHAVRALQRREPKIVLTRITDQVAVGYARLLEALNLTRLPGFAAPAAAALGEERPQYADQKLWWALIALEAAARGGVLPDVLDPRLLLEKALAAVEQRGEDVFMAARFIAPLGLALVALLPDAPPAAVRAFVATPVLTGKMLAFEGREIETLDSNGLSLVYEAMGDPEGEVLERRGRFDDAIEKLRLPTPPLNLGAVVAAARLLALKAEEADVGKGAEAWASTAQRAREMVTTAAPKRK